MATDSAPRGMLDEPTLSRQWVNRRLQRALTLDLAAAALYAGMARTSRGDSSLLMSRLAADASERARVLRELIVRLGSTPYSSIGLSRALSHLGGSILGLVGRWAWKPLLEPLVTHTLSEYDVLLAFVDDAPGVDLDLTEPIAPMVQSAAADRAALLAG